MAGPEFTDGGEYFGLRVLQKSDPEVQVFLGVADQRLII